MKSKIMCVIFGCFMAGAQAQTNTFPTTGSAGAGTTSPRAILETSTSSLSEFYGSDVAAIGSNLVLYGSGSRTPGTGPSLTFMMSSAGGGDWEQARILATPDNSNSYSAHGRLYLQVRDSYNPGVGGTWNWRTGLMINAAGDVGIGVSSPTNSIGLNRTIDIGGTSAPGIAFHSTSGGQEVAIGSGGDGLITVAQGSSTASNNMIRFLTEETASQFSATERMRITSAGNVGIGTTDPQGYKLAVNGSMIATSVKVKTYANWPDYVFAPAYRLRSLGELERYINLNGHLPEVPSAEEVKKDGIDLADMNARLLKKIEELTLYLIVQGKEIERLKTKVNLN